MYFNTNTNTNTVIVSVKIHNMMYERNVLLMFFVQTSNQTSAISVEILVHLCNKFVPMSNVGHFIIYTFLKPFNCIYFP